MTPAGNLNRSIDAPDRDENIDPILEKYPMALPGGSILAGQYIIEKPVGQGGFGITYIASDHKTKQRVALKEYFPESLATRIERSTVRPLSFSREENFEYGRDLFLEEAIQI